jgi:hypothetical protein
MDEQESRKRCPRCGTVKLLSEFAPRKTPRRNGERLQAYCRLCYTVYWREYYHNNKEGHTRRAKRRDAAIRALVRGAKDMPCADCGQRFPYYVMEFDHRSGEPKCFNIGDVNDRRRVGRSRLQAEIAKCDVVCANCHRERTHQRRRRNADGQTR